MVSFHWERLNHASPQSAAAALAILIFCSIVCLSYLATMIYIFKWYIPLQKALFSKSYQSRSSVYRAGNATPNLSNRASHTRTASASQNNMPPNSIRLSVTSGGSTEHSPAANTVNNDHENDTEHTDTHRGSLTAPYEQRGSVIINDLPSITEQQHSNHSDLRLSTVDADRASITEDGRRNSRNTPQHLNVPGCNKEQDAKEPAVTNFRFANKKQMAARPPWQDLEVNTSSSTTTTNNNGNGSAKRNGHHKEPSLTFSSVTKKPDDSSITKYSHITVDDEEETRCIILSLPNQNFRTILYLAVTCSTIFILTTTIINCVMLFSDNTFELNCSVQTAITLFLVLQRILLYSYFILRLSFSFKESSYRIATHKLVTCSVSMCITALTPAMLAQYYAEFRQCEYQPLVYCFVAGVLQDIFWAIFTVSWYIIKLVHLENSLKRTKTVLSSHSLLPDVCTQTKTAPSASNSNSAGSSSSASSLSDTNTNTKSTQVRVSSSIAHSPPIYEDETMNSSADTDHDEKEERKYKQRALAKKRALERQRSKSAETVSKSDRKSRTMSSIGDRFRHSISSLHKKAHSKLFAALQKNLKIKRLVKKLLILTITAVSSTLLLGCSIGWISIWSGISLDLIVNMTCMLLSFRCSDNIFKKLYPCCSYD